MGKEQRIRNGSEEVCGESRDNLDISDDQLHMILLSFLAEFIT